MSKRVGLWAMTMIAGLCVAGVANATTLFVEDFNDAATAAARFDQSEYNAGWDGGANCTFGGGVVTMSDYHGRWSAIRTNAANAFDDSAAGAVTYSVVEDFGTFGARVSYLYARLGSSGLGDGYQLMHYYDGSNYVLSLVRLNGGVATSLWGASSTVSQAATSDPTTMSITLTNTATSVDYTVTYGSFSVSGSDTGAGRITSGVGVGVQYTDNGSGDFTSCSFDDLTVTQVPEPITLVMLAAGAVAMVRRRGC